MPNTIKSERVRAGLSQDDLAERLNVSAMTIRNWESGRNAMPVSKLVEMSDIFQCSTDYILGRCDERTVTAIR